VLEFLRYVAEARKASPRVRAGRPGQLPRHAPSESGTQAHPRAVSNVEFLVERVIGRRHVFVVGFERSDLGDENVPQHLAAVAEQDDDGWRARSIAALMGTRKDVSKAGDEPRVLLTAIWGSSTFTGAGRMSGDRNSEARSVRLRFAVGMELKDEVTGGWVVFFFATMPVSDEAVVEVLADDGRVIPSRPLMARHDPARS
jgi:hypothetical protein